MELLYRSRAGVTASSEGLRLLPLVRSIVADCAELEFTVNELHGLHTGLIRVGTFTSVANMWIPSLLVSFQKLYPGIEFTLMNSENYFGNRGLDPAWAGGLRVCEPAGDDGSAGAFFEARYARCGAPAGSPACRQQRFSHCAPAG